MLSFHVSERVVGCNTEIKKNEIHTYTHTRMAEFLRLSHKNRPMAVISAPERLFRYLSTQGFFFSPPNACILDLAAVIYGWKMAAVSKLQLLEGSKHSSSSPCDTNGQHVVFRSFWIRIPH